MVLLHHEGHAKISYTLRKTERKFPRYGPLVCRKGMGQLSPHPMDKWRDLLRHGLMTRFVDTNIILTGGVDDIWH